MGRVRPNARFVAIASVVLVGAAAILVVPSRDRSPAPAPAASAAPRPDGAPASAREPSVAPATAPAPEDPFVAGERCVDEAMAFIARDGPVLASVSTLAVEADVTFPDGGAPMEQPTTLKFRAPDALFANFSHQGRDTSFLLVRDQGRMIRDRIRVTNLNNSLTTKHLMPVLRSHRRVLQDVGRMLAPKRAGARFRLFGVVADAKATGGRWCQVVRTAPGEPDRTIFYGTEPRRDGAGLRAIAPDRMIVHPDAASEDPGDAYRFADWSLDATVDPERPADPRGTVRVPTRIVVHAIGTDPAGAPLVTLTVRSLKVNAPIDP